MFEKDLSSMAPILEEAYKLKFGERPNYNKLKFMFESRFLEYNISPKGKFSW